MDDEGGSDGSNPPEVVDDDVDVPLVDDDVSDVVAAPFKSCGDIDDAAVAARFVPIVVGKIVLTVVMIAFFEKRERLR